jgi:hypothetical protein
MAPIVESIEIARTPEDVFAYATDFTHYPEWQEGVVSVRPDGDGQRGSRAVVNRRAGPRTLARIEELTELNPPTSWTVRGVGGRLTAIARGAIEPLENGHRSRVTITLEFQAYAVGKLLLSVVRRQARRQLPTNARRLKELLERRG